MLAAFDLAVVVWVTDALDDAVSAVVIAALMAVLLGISQTLQIRMYQLAQCRPHDCHEQLGNTVLTCGE